MSKKEILVWVFLVVAFVLLMVAYAHSPLSGLDLTPHSW